MSRYYRKVIRITAEDSPNVQFALAQRAAGIDPTNDVVLPGVLPWDEYTKRRLMWDMARQRVSLDALFPNDAGTLLFPDDALLRAAEASDKLKGRRRTARAVGCDPAEGGDNTAFAAVDEFGVIEVLAVRTPDTNVIPGMLIAFGKKHGAQPQNWVLDRGGGKVHADRLRAMKYPVRTVGFGSKATLQLRRGIRLLKEKQVHQEDRYAYKNMRAQLFGELSELVAAFRPRQLYGVFLGGDCFAIPREQAELRRQLSKIPLMTTEEGVLMLPPKGGTIKKENSKIRTLIELIGHSPDEADAVVLAVHGMLHKPVQRSAGAVV